MINIYVGSLCSLTQPFSRHLINISCSSCDSHHPDTCDQSRANSDDGGQSYERSDEFCESKRSSQGDRNVRMIATCMDLPSH